MAGIEQRDAVREFVALSLDLRELRLPRRLSWRL